MIPFNNRPTQTRAPATGWASAAPWAAFRANAPTTAAETERAVTSNNTPQESCRAASWAY